MPEHSLSFVRTGDTHLQGFRHEVRKVGFGDPRERAPPAGRPHGPLSRPVYRHAGVSFAYIP